MSDVPAWLTSLRRAYSNVHDGLDGRTAAYPGYHPFRIGAHLTAGGIDLTWRCLLTPLDGVELVTTNRPTKHPIRFVIGVCYLLVSPVFLALAAVVAIGAVILVGVSFVTYLLVWLPLFLGLRLAGWQSMQSEVEPYERDEEFADLFADRRFLYDTGFTTALVKNTRAVTVHAGAGRYGRAVLRVVGSLVIALLGTLAYGIGGVLFVAGVMLVAGVLVSLLPGSLLPAVPSWVRQALLVTPGVVAGLYYVYVFAREIAR